MSEAQTATLDRGAYDVIRKRLLQHGEDLQQRLDQLNEARKQAFGSIETKLLGNERITTENNCVPRDMVSIGDKFLFGYNVQLGLRSETHLEDVFAIYSLDEDGFHRSDLAPLQDESFLRDFRALYKYYKHTTFAKFGMYGPHLFMKFRVGKTIDDFKTFKWLLKDGQLTYVDNRSDHEFVYPPQHEFEWTRATRDDHRSGAFPHVSIQDRLFVETTGGDLTIKVEDNTESGHGIYAEPVEHADQTLDDADIFYASIGHVILLKMKPYREKAFRYFVYNEKMEQVHRLDAIQDACVLLPDDHGLIFPKGYYLLTGELKTFDTGLEDLLFSHRIASPNGEDFLYVFYNRHSGTHVLLAYNLIEQKVDTPLICHGFSVFENGRMLFFRTEDEPQKHHAIQIWQTPFVGPDYPLHGSSDSPLAKIGNKDIVRAMAECHEIINLLDKEDEYADLYLDINKKASDVIDSYFWINDASTHNLGEALVHIREAANSAIDEFEKVRRIRKSTASELARVSKEADELFQKIRRTRFEEVSEFVALLAQLRTTRGEIIGLKERRYIDLEQVEALEQNAVEYNEKLSQECVNFLLEETALEPYAQRVAAEEAAIAELTRVSVGREIDERIAATSKDLELLIDIVSNLKIEDATQTTRIIDGISAIYSDVNRVKSALKNKLQDLAKEEGAAEFHAQLKLLSQSIVNYLDVCDTPAKCEGYLTKLMVGVEVLEGKFSEFDDFIETLAEKREEIYNAFENKRLQLIEARNKRASALASAAERILKGIRNRAGQFKTVNEINGYFAGDLMIEKVRDIVAQLLELEDTVKADDIQSRLKTIREESVRQLKDRQDLYEEGENIIKLGNHRFYVNVQNLALTIVQRDGGHQFHLTGTDFFEPIQDEQLEQTRAVWEMSTPAENGDVYRAEYLAYLLLQHWQDEGMLETAEAWDDAELQEQVRRFMSPRYQDNYAKGVHDWDAAQLLRALVPMHRQLGLLRFSPQVRACGLIFWFRFCPQGPKTSLKTAFASIGSLLRAFPNYRVDQGQIKDLRQLMDRFSETSDLFPAAIMDEAARYVFHELADGDQFAISQEAAEVYVGFQGHLKHKHLWQAFEADLKALQRDPDKQFHLCRNWLNAYLQQEYPQHDIFLDEVCALLMCGHYHQSGVSNAAVTATVGKLKGSHAVIEDGNYALDYNSFSEKLSHHVRQTVPHYEQYQQRKQALTTAFAEDLRLDSFKPRVLTSFVRNKLIDQLYLPLIGANFAKQMGGAGEDKRTDRMGLLLLISPPGYGKTTLMEYVCSRLGLVFMKINGPAIGHDITSLDPVQAPHASAREELNKLNLALEMGDNVMIYLDDIQHCNPEFLQKFISLCDGQRKIEGVYKGKTRTYDLRGKKVCVVMAGNPYTETGEKFRIPDMLANRADTYNLGDIIGETQDIFELSYVENALTSNPVLEKLASRSQADVYAALKVAQTGSREGINFEGNYSSEEINEFVNVLKKLLRIRDVILKVNLSYIRSAAMEDAYRTEPPFKLQGSYRNMNKIAEKVLPIMNDNEVEALLASHYEGEAQTLTTGAEANLLQFYRLAEQLTADQQARWDEICQVFQKKQAMLGVGGDDKVGQVVLQLREFNEGLAGIAAVLSERLAQGNQPLDIKLDQVKTVLSNDTLAALRELLPKAVEVPEVVVPAASSDDPHKSARYLMKALKHQFNIMHHWIKPMFERDQQQTQQLNDIAEAVKASMQTHRQVYQYLKRLSQDGE